VLKLIIIPHLIIINPASARPAQAVAHAYP